MERDVLGGGAGLGTETKASMWYIYSPQTFFFILNILD